MYNEEENNTKSRMGIYLIENTVNNKKYIGQTSGIILNRIKRHLYELKNNKHYNAYLQREFNLFGINSFEFKILFKNIISIEELNVLEINTIKQYDSTNEKLGYNILLGGENSMLPEKIKHKISKSLINNQYTSKKIVQYDIQNGSVLRVWESANDIKRELGFYIGNIIQCCKHNPKYPHSYKFGWRYLNEYDASNIKDLTYELNSKKNKKILAVKNNEIIQFKSIKEAEEYFGVHRKFIHRVLSGKRKKYHNYVFKYVE